MMKISNNHHLNGYSPKSINTKAKCHKELSCLDLADKHTNRQTKELCDIDNASRTPLPPPLGEEEQADKRTD